MRKNLKTFRDHLEEEKQRIENERHRKKMAKRLMEEGVDDKWNLVGKDDLLNKWLKRIQS